MNLSHSTQGNWDDAICHQLAQLWADGLSAKAIAERLELGSRNKVISKIRRLGLPAPAKKIGLEGRPKHIRPPRPQLEKPVVENGYADALHLSLIDLEDNQCRFAFGDGPFTFCGHAVVAGSYCGLHDYICHEANS